MSEDSIQTRVERIVFEKFYGGPLAGSKERLAKALIEEFALAQHDQATPGVEAVAWAVSWKADGRSITRSYDQRHAAEWQVNFLGTCPTASEIQGPFALYALPTTIRNKPMLNVEEYVADYEFRGDTDYKPNDGEQSLIIDAIHGYIAASEDQFPTTIRGGREEIARAINPSAWSAHRVGTNAGQMAAQQEAFDAADRVLALPAPLPHANKEEMPEERDVAQRAWELCDGTEGTVFADEFGEHYRVPRVLWDALADAVARHDMAGWDSFLLPDGGAALARALPASIGAEKP